MRISDWSSDVCSADLEQVAEPPCRNLQRLRHVGSKLGLDGVTLGIAREQRELARQILDVVHDEGEAAIEFVEPPRLGQGLLALRFGEIARRLLARDAQPIEIFPVERARQARKRVE